ncbi:MAG: metallophosphoesterase [Clostridiales bacterium]|nr:metallophosphoesterase [Clostridiales bacterium]
MPKYLSVISDSHGARSNLARLVGDFTVSDKIVFLGDGLNDLNELFEFEDKIIMVAGNCDFMPFVSKRETFIIEGVKFLAVHGDEFSVKSSLTRLKEYAKKIGVDVVLYGHTHVADIKEEDGITFINPGTLSRYGLKETFAFISVDNGKVNAKIIPISRR